MRLTPLAAACVVVLAAAACKDVQGSGTVATRNVPVPAGSHGALVVQGAFQCSVKAGDAWTLTAEADDNLLDLLLVEAKPGGELVLRTSRGWSSPNGFKLALTTPGVRGLRAEGATNLDAGALVTKEPEGAWAAANGASHVRIASWDATSLQVGAHGASSVTVDRTAAKTLDARATGASKVHVTCDVEEAKVRAEGASEATGSPLRAKRADVVTSGASKADLDVVERLKAAATGASTVTYGGTPTVEGTASKASEVKPR